MPKKSAKRKSPAKRKSSARRNSSSGKYSHVKPGQTVTFANGTCAKRLSNGRFQFVKKTSCKPKRGQWKRASQKGGDDLYNSWERLYDAIEDQEVDDVKEVLEELNKTDLARLLSKVYPYHSSFDKKKNRPPIYPMTPIQFAATTTADDIFKVLLDHGADPYVKVTKNELYKGPFNSKTESYVGLNSFEIIKELDLGVYMQYFKKWDTKSSPAPKKH